MSQNDISDTAQTVAMCFAKYGLLCASGFFICGVAQSIGIVPGATINDVFGGTSIGGTELGKNMNIAAKKTVPVIKLGFTTAALTGVANASTKMIFGKSPDGTR
jgi:hypothetical protein